MKIDAKLVKKLREKTDAPMMDCKNALNEANGDLTLAEDVLRKNGILKSAKKLNRVTNNGLVFSVVKDGVAVILELNSETDFSAKNIKFQSFVSALADFALTTSFSDLAEFLTLVFNNGATVEEEIKSLIAIIGENINLSRIERIECGDNYAYSYIHGDRIAVVVVLDKDNKALGEDICLQIAAMNPRVLKRDLLPQSLIDKEVSFYKEELLKLNKPEAVMNNILQGKLNKWYKEVCLVDQVFIKDDTILVQDLLKRNDANILEYRYYLLGQLDY